MTFKKGETPKGAIPFKKGQSGNPDGAKVGIQKRSTIAKKVLDMIWNVPDDIYNEIKKIYPLATKKMSVEDIIYIKQAWVAIQENNTQAAKFIMDSRYGSPKQEIEHSGEVEIGFDLGKVSDNELATILQITQNARNAE